MKSSHNEHTVIISAAAPLAEAIEHYGLDFRPIVRKCGIDPDKNYGPNERLPVTKLQKIWRLAVELTGDPCFGLTFANYIQPASLHGMGLAWAASDTLKDGLLRLVRYQKVVSTALNAQLVEESDRYNLVFHATAYRTPPAPVSVEGGLAAFFRMCRITAGPGIRPLEVTFTHSNPKCINQFTDFFNTKVRFSAQDNRIVFDKATIELPLPSAHPELARVNDMMVIEYLKHFDKQGIATQVRAQIIEQLPNGTPTQDTIAQLLNLSLRNLQRKLHSEGTNFKELIDETRKELAIQYLKGSDRPVIEIGFLLGFSESSNFSRAFRRWTGVSPQHYRQTTMG